MTESSSGVRSRATGASKSNSSSSNTPTSKNAKAGRSNSSSARLSGKSLDRIIAVSSFNHWEDSETVWWWLTFSAITIAAFATRLYRIHLPNHVCWDETHFGKMGSWYINHTFFFDVHPPLGKMLIGLSGHLTGYNGTFAFNKPGDSYEDHPILGMRLFCVLLGTLIVPFSYVIVWNLSRSISSSVLASSMLLFDVGMITLSQYILLDPIMMFFIVGSTMGMALFKSRGAERPFTLSWWFWLAWTGFFLGCAISVKFVGLFVVALVGLFTAYDLWRLYSNLANSLLTVGRHFLARALCLILLPVLLYTFFFWVHLAVLYRSGNGDGFYSSAFQSTLEGNSLHNASMPRHVAYGAVITVKNHRTGGAYLHSHWHLYPEGVGARQQQVTSYSHKDDNNRWRIKKFNEESTADGEPIEFVKNGDLVRLEHTVTERNLHSHQEKAPVTRKHYQVTCYGEKGLGDANDVFRIEFDSGKVGERLEAVKTRFKLVHYLMNCALYSHNKQLPKWGFEQLEVTCTPNVYETKNTLWNVEDNHFPRLPNVSVVVYAPSFLEKFIESHAVMFQGNAGLKPKEGEVTSRPWQWPINYRGQFFSGNDYKIYLLGNPIIWWLNLLLLFLYAAICLVVLVRQRRGCSETSYVAAENARFMSASMWLFLGWALHYFPFYGMGRILYFHHYFPAAIFSSMLSAVIVDYLLKVVPVLLLHVIRRRRERRGGSDEVKEEEQRALTRYRNARLLYHLVYSVLLSALAYSFYLFSPLAYGILRLPTSSTTTNGSSTGDSLLMGAASQLASNMSTSDGGGGDSTSAPSSESSVDYSQERSMASLRWMESWEF